MNQIHDTCIIGNDVIIGRGNKILPYTVIYGPTEIGDNNIIGPCTTIGTAGQNTKEPRYDSSNKKIRIGSNNIIKEFTTIQKPVNNQYTIIEDYVFLMSNVHIPHDAIIEKNAVITPGVVLGGHTIVCQGANIGLGVKIHQFIVVGQYTMIAAGAILTKNVKPFSKYIPHKEVRVNDYAIQKYDFEYNKDEIYAYVLSGKKPSDRRILGIVQYFEKLHKESRRELYE